MSNLSSSSTEPANNLIQRRRQEAGSLSTEEADVEQLPKNLIRQNSMTETVTFENSAANDNASSSLSSRERKQSPANSTAKQQQLGQYAANYIDSLRITFDNGDDSDAKNNYISERVAKMLESNQYSDVVFFVGLSEERIYAHKFVLSVGSEVFGAMLNNKHFCRPSNENPLQQEIRIEDIEPNVFKLILKFLYTDKVKLDPDNVMAVLYTARKYAINALENACTNYLKNNLCPENAVMILKQARFFDLDDLADAAMSIINHDATEILQSDNFLDIDQQTLSTILQNDTLRIKEITIFKTVIRWAEAQCHQKQLSINDYNLRQVLGPLLFQIRFPLMSIEEFASIAQFSNILTDKEKVDLFVNFVSPVKPEIPFNQDKRCEIFGKEMSVNRFQRIESRWGYTGTTDKIKFTVDVPVFITAVGLYGSMQGDSQHDAKIKLIDFSTNKVLSTNEVTFKSDGTPDPFKVQFKEPVEISPGCTYVISTLLKGPDSWFGSKGLRRIARQSVIGNSTGAITFQFSYAAGNNNGTSVDDGQIPEIFFCVKMT